ncbi:hypothetical protein NECID01_1197 [Nematocida sp. AWRm77]|nr:hypothetical protein NECID01_1197 [Nematocida sp. AWRm77]
MKTTPACITLCALAMLYLCTAIKVNFKLENMKEDLICNVPKGMFRTIDDKDSCCDLFVEPDETSSDLEEECEISLSRISTPEQYEHFKAFCETDLTAHPAEDKGLLQYQQDLTKDLFDRFLSTADFLGLQGKHFYFFNTNMVCYGLLGKHTKDITDLSLRKDNNLLYDTLWNLLHAFFDQTGVESRTIIHFSTGKMVLLIEKPDAHPKKLNYEYIPLSQIPRIRVVLYSELGPTGSQKKERNEAILVWLLLGIGEFSVDIQYTIDISSEGFSVLSQTIEQFTKESEKGGFVYVEGLRLHIDHINHTSLPTALRLVPYLSRLKLSFNPSCILNAALLSSLVSGITSCKSLKVLKITGQFLDSVVISRLVESIPNIEQLSLSCQILDVTAIGELNKCTCLESLEVFGVYQPSAVVQTLVKHLSFLKKLDIWCGVLDPAATDSFEVCIQLEKLTIVGELQPTTVVQALAKHLPSLKELSIECQFLDSTAVKSFKACKHLEKLEIVGKGSASFLAKLLEALPSLQELRIEIATADLALADALRKYSNLRSLMLIVGQFTPEFIPHYLQDPFPSLTSLKLCKRDIKKKYSKEDKMAVKKARARGIQIFLFVVLS